jgi:hypothetical protein
MKFRTLRIVWSIVCVLACVLLIVFWVRSYKWRDYCSLGQFTNRGWAAESAVGQFAFRNYPINHNAPPLRWWQTAVSDDSSRPTNKRFGFDVYFGHDYAGIVAPYWLLVLLTAIVAALTGVNRPIRFRFGPLKCYVRYLRIAISVVCCIACLLLIALWVRSYWWIDGAIGPISSNKVLLIGSNSGSFSFRIDDSSQHLSVSQWQADHHSIEEIASAFRQLGQKITFGGPQFGFSGTGNDFFVAHWIIIAVIATIGAISSAPWLRWTKRFSLRTLLLATTILALALGTFAWLTHR